jgi:hypothetical protein
MGIIKKNLLLWVLVVILTVGAACGNSSPTTSELPDKTWLSPGKIRVSDVLPGDRIEQSVTIHNGSEVATTFLVYYRTPDYVEDNFVMAPVDATNWVEISHASVLLAPKEQREILVTLDLPDDIQAPERWEFWIGVKPQKENTLTAELCSRWLITMKGD